MSRIFILRTLGKQVQRQLQSSSNSKIRFLHLTKQPVLSQTNNIKGIAFENVSTTVKLNKTDGTVLRELSTVAVENDSKNGNKSKEKIQKKLTDEQHSYLEQCFKENMYPDRDTKVAIAQKSSLSTKYVNKWFTNRRLKARKNGEEVQQLNSGKSSNRRKQLTKSQKKQLEEYFKVDNSPSLQKREEIARSLELDVSRVDRWFCNKCSPSYSIEPTSENEISLEQSLENIYENIKFPGLKMRKSVAEKLETSERKVNQWFKKRRKEDHKSFSPPQADKTLSGTDSSVSLDDSAENYDSDVAYSDLEEFPKLNKSASLQKYSFCEDKEGDEHVLQQEAPEDTFGTLAEEAEGIAATNYSYSREDLTDFEEEPYRRLAKSRRHNPIYYGLMIEKLSKQGKVFEAIEVLEKQMLVDDRVRPTEYVFTCLIGTVGRVGYTKKAFQLYNQMKKFGIKPKLPCYTALFNACSNSPYKEDALERAKNLRQLLIEKEIDLNVTNYNAMIKAFGRCGDILTAFSLVDEIYSKGLKPDQWTYSTLLSVCISDRETGLKYAIEIWKRMRKRKVAFNNFHYNLLLRLVRDCGLGDLDYANTLLPKQNQVSSMNTNRPEEQEKTEHVPWWKWTPKHEQTFQESQKRLNSYTTITPVDKDFSKDKSTILSANDDNSDQTSVNISDNVSDGKRGNFALILENTPETNLDSIETPSKLLNAGKLKRPEIPNILNPRVKWEQSICIADVSTPQKRLGLFGGMEGILSHMKKDKLKPDIKTFTLMLDNIPSTREAEDKLLEAMDKSKIKIDTDFVNLLIKKRNMRRDFVGARNLLPWMSARGLVPNIMTFGCLAVGCHTRKTGLQLLQDMEKIGVVANFEIHSTLLNRGDGDFFYIIDILKSMKSCGVKPNKSFLMDIEKRVQFARKMIVKTERREEKIPAKYHSKYFKESYVKFKLYYSQWLKSQTVEPETHPWQKYRQPTHSSETRYEDRQIDQTDQNSSIDKQILASRA